MFSYLGQFPVVLEHTLTLENKDAICVVLVSINLKRPNWAVNSAQLVQHHWIKVQPAWNNV